MNRCETSALRADFVIQPAFITLRRVMKAPCWADEVGASRDKVAFSPSARAKSGCA